MSSDLFGIEIFRDDIAFYRPGPFAGRWVAPSGTQDAVRSMRPENLSSEQNARHKPGLQHHGGCVHQPAMRKSPQRTKRLPPLPP